MTDFELRSDRIVYYKDSVVGHAGRYSGARDGPKRWAYLPPPKPLARLSIVYVPCLARGNVRPFPPPRKGEGGWHGRQTDRQTGKRRANIILSGGSSRVNTIVPLGSRSAKKGVFVLPLTSSRGDRVTEPSSQPDLNFPARLVIGYV